MGPVALLTDFGYRDGYVASMKAVIQTIAPKANIVDITHEISSQNIEEAGFVLWSAYRYFPRKTIFVCVVDPGVGTERNIVAVKTQEHFFLAPDNGLLDMVLAESEIKQAVRLTRKKYFLPQVSNTFHGRDMFSPVASHLLNGEKLKSLGPSITIKKPKSILKLISHKGEYAGGVIYTDRFGNLVTNLKMQKSTEAEVNIKSQVISLRKTYGDVKEGELLALIGSMGLVEIAVRNGSAKDFLQADYSTPVKIKLK